MWWRTWPSERPTPGRRLHELAAKFEEALAQGSFLVPQDASEALKEEAGRVRFYAPSYHEALSLCEQGVSARNGVSVGSVTREPAGAEYRPVEIFGIVLGAVGLAGWWRGCTLWPNTST